MYRSVCRMQHLKRLDSVIVLHIQVTYIQKNYLFGQVKPKGDGLGFMLDERINLPVAAP